MRKKRNYFLNNEEIKQNGGWLKMSVKFTVNSQQEKCFQFSFERVKTSFVTLL